MDNLTWTHIPVSDTANLPLSEGVYMIKSDFRILYVGQSVRLRNRVLQHKKFLSILASQYGNLLISYTLTPDYKKIEKELIQEYSPLHNGACRKKKISDVIEQIKVALDGRKTRWLACECRIPEGDLSKKMTGKLLFTEPEIIAINNRLNCNISFHKGE